MPVTLTPNPTPNVAEGYYAKRAKLLLASGQANFDSILQLDGRDVADEAIVQGVLDKTDRYVDGRAIVLGVTFGGADGHAIATDAAIFGPLSDEASDLAWFNGFRLRGDTGAAGDAAATIEGQYARSAKQAKANIDALLAAHRQAQLAVGGSDGIEGILGIGHGGCGCTPADAMRVCQ